MRIALRRMVWAAGVLTTAALATDARAQTPGGPLPPLRPVWYFNQNPGPAFVTVPRFTSIQLQTSVMVPDGGTALVGGYGRLSEGRVEYGVPGLGKLPYAGRAFRNVGYGRSAVSGTVSASVRVISLYEEEYRQTGYRSR